MSASKAKIEANCRNAIKSTGPQNTELTSQNAVKHGLLTLRLTRLDSEERYAATWQELQRDFQPVGRIEYHLVERIAFFMERLYRLTFCESVYIEDQICKDCDETLTVGAIDQLASHFQRYETAIENKLYRALHELERLQRLRRGEKVPAPVNVDISFQGVAADLASFGNPPQPLSEEKPVAPGEPPTQP